MGVRALPQQVLSHFSSISSYQSSIHNYEKTTPAFLDYSSCKKKSPLSQVYGSITINNTGISPIPRRYAKQGGDSGSIIVPATIVKSL